MVSILHHDVVASVQSEVERQGDLQPSLQEHQHARNDVEILLDPAVQEVS
jgi:hypothetical protein